MFRIMRASTEARALSRRKRLLFSLALLAMGGCGSGTLVVDHAVRVTATRAEGAGAPRPVNVTQLPRNERSLSPFAAVQISDEFFRWTIGTSTLGFGGRIENISDTRQCFRFDRALLSSTQNVQPSPLRITSMQFFVAGKWELAGSTIPELQREIAPVSFCVDPRRVVEFSMTLYMPTWFDQGTLFDSRLSADRKRLVDPGKGNWFAIELPGERRDITDVYHVVVTAIDSKGRISHR